MDMRPDAAKPPKQAPCPAQDHNWSWLSVDVAVCSACLEERNETGVGERIEERRFRRSSS